MDVRSELEAIGADLAAQISALRSGADIPSGGISFGKRVGEGTSIAIERFADVAVHDQLVQQLAAVEVALQRLADGTYGRCEACEQPIAPGRLEAVPWASRCIHCA